MKGRPEPARKRLLFYLLVLFLFFGGLIILLVSSLRSHRNLHREQDQHLTDLAAMADQNASYVLSRCHQELLSLLSLPSLSEAEQKAAAGGETGELRDYLSRAPVLKTSYAACILVLNGETILLSSDGGAAGAYTKAPEAEENGLPLITDSRTGALYFAVTENSAASGLTYAVLVDLSDFYRRVVVSETFDSCWTVLYDPVSGLSIENRTDQTEYRFLPESTLTDRQDGFSIMEQYMTLGETGTESYIVTTEGLGDRRARIAVIPCQVSENGLFTVSVATYEDNLLDLFLRSLSMLLAMLSITGSISMLVFFLLHSDVKGKEVRERLTALEQERELNAKLLRQHEEIVHHQKLEIIGTLTAGVAHEFNNLLSPIMGNSLLILEKLPPGEEELYDNALDIYEASRRAKDLVSRISGLSRRSPAARMQLLSPSALIDGVLSLVSSSIPKNVLAEKDIRTRAGFLGDETQLSHLFINLIINALQAMEPAGGILTLGASDDGVSVIFTVSDTGTGIRKEQLPHIFDPFFTTKAPGKGTGLGLAIAQQTASNHGGSISASNNPEGGATFTITLPIRRITGEED